MHTQKNGHDGAGWSKQKADIDVGILTGCMGLEVVIVFIMAKPLAMKYGERQVLLYGLVVAIIGQLITVPFGSLPASVGEVQNATANATAAATGDMGTAWSIFGPSMLFSGGHDFGVEEGTSGLRSSSGPSSSANTTEATGGCHEYVWCDTTPHVSLFQFGLSAFVRPLWFTLYHPLLPHVVL